MKISATLRNQTALWEWDQPLKYIEGKKLYVKYPFPLDKVPTHLANFAILIALQDILAWNGGKVEVSELTKNEHIEINRILYRNYQSKGCAGQENNHKVTRHIPSVVPEHIVDDPLDLGSEVIVCNGLGKDGINCTLLAKELGYNPRPFTILNQYKTPELLVDRVTAYTKFYEKNSLNPIIAWTNYWNIVNKAEGILHLDKQKTGFYPYAFALIAASATGSGTILDGIQIHNNKKNLESEAFYCPGETIFQFHNITNATGITLSSPLRPLSNYGSQRLLAERWPEHLVHQRSCMRGIPWCCECAKCHRKALYLKEMGINPQKVGLKPYDKSKLGLDRYGPVNDSVVQITAKLRGDPYDDWPWKANNHVFPLIWEGKNLKHIFQNHFETYNEDPGVDPSGWSLEPSKWEAWLR